MGLFKNIVKGKFDFPEGDFVSLTAKDLITRMLTTDPKERLGSFAGAEKDIKTHPFSRLEAKGKTERYPKLTGAEQRMFQKF
jgi:hypothetical protein